jgi:predicted permease
MFFFSSCLPGLHGSGIQKSLVVGIVVVRYIALPLTGILIIRGAHQIGLVHPDPLYQFILLLQYAVPPAMNIGTYISTFRYNLEQFHHNITTLFFVLKSRESTVAH